jgi:hypothetical protein
VRAAEPHRHHLAPGDGGTHDGDLACESVPLDVALQKISGRRDRLDGDDAEPRSSEGDGGRAVLW